MKIVCDNCSAKYQISDDKVRNKTFKIRCKKCSHVIVVRGGQQPDDAQEAAQAEAPEAAAADPVAAAAAPAAADPDAIWHVVINRENVGPLTPSQVEGHFQSGDIDAETFIWSEGMTDWSRLGSVPQFAHLAPAPVVAAAAAAPVAAAAAAVDADATQQAPSSMFPSEDDDVIASNNVADTPAAAPAGGGMFPAEEPASPRISTAAQLRNQRNENSVLFSLDSLAAEAESKKASVSNTGGSEASGLIDISALSSIGAPGVGGDDPFGSAGMAPAPLTAAAPVTPLVAPKSNNNTGLLIALVVIILLLLGGGGAIAWLLLKDDPKDDKPDIAATEAPAKLSVGGPSEAEKKAAEEKAAAEKKAAEEKAAAEAAAKAEADAGADDGEDEKKLAAAPKASRRATRTRRATRKPSASKSAEPKPAARKPAARKPAAKKESTSEVDDLLGALDGSGGGSKSRAASPAAAAPAAAADPLLPEKLTRRQILTVVKRNARSITTCKEGTDASGTVPVELVIGRAGRVTSATVKSGPQKGTPVGSCIERKVRAFRFPQFSGDPMRIVMPFAL